MLLTAGADVNQQCDQGASPLAVSAQEFIVGPTNSKMDLNDISFFRLIFILISSLFRDIICLKSEFHPFWV